jgi:hypothetical protein
MNGAVLHTGFDIIAWAAAGLSIYWVTRRSGRQFPAVPTGDWRYIVVLVFGAGVGAVVSSRAIARFPCRAAPNMAARMTAGSAPTTSSIPAWR